MTFIQGRREATSPPGSGLRGRRLLVGLGLLWLGGIGLGTAWFMEIERQAGKEIPVATQWPRTLAVRPLPGHPTILLAAHPKCPCTRASLDELAEIVATSPVPLRGYVLFLRPADLDPSWARTDLWDRVLKIPGFLPLEDVDGREARLLGATTSGHVLYFDGQGSLRYSGGITSARGIRGESDGKTSLRSLLTQGSPRFARAPVYGCPLEDQDMKAIR